MEVAFMKNPFFTGVCTALVTPFLDDQVNYSMLEQLIQRQMEAGIPAIVIGGTTGEAPTLTDAERIELFRRSKQFAGNQLKIICGTGGNSTAHSIALSKAAQDVGADGLLVVAPYYNKGNFEGQLKHYIAIAESVDIPVIVYNVPGRTGVDLSVELYQQLSAVPNIIGVKEASGNIVKISRIRNACPQEFTVWSGNDDMIVASMALGAKGVISVLSNLLPEQTLAMASAALTGDFASAAELQHQLLPVIDALFREVNPIPIKAAMKMVGYDCGPCRLPLGPVSSETETLLRQLL
jgi:4-hydroxy-tetrahydrodipicolinate synthase